VVDSPDKVPGDIGLFLVWGSDRNRPGIAGPLRALPGDDDVRDVYWVAILNCDSRPTWANGLHLPTRPTQGRLLKVRD
jgi:hypothetical protein